MNPTALRRSAAYSLVAMWVIQEAKLLTNAKFASYAGIAVFLLYFAIAFLMSRATLRLMIVLVTTAAVGLSVYFSAPDALAQGAESAVLFSAFLVAMQMLKVALEGSPGMRESRAQFLTLAPEQRHDSVLLRTHLTASVLAAGGLAAVAPLLDHDRPRDQRRHFAESAIQGVGLAVLWSPFFVAMAVSTRLAKDVTLGAAVLSGVAMAMIGLILSHLLYGSRPSAVWLSPLRRTFIEAAALAASVIAANRIWDIGNLEAVVIGIPLLALFIARHAVHTQTAYVVSRWRLSLEAISVEALVVGVALVLGEVLKELFSQGALSIPFSANAWPIPALISLPTVVMLLTALIGLHPIVSASLLLPVLTSVDGLHPLVATGSVLLGWMMCVVLSRFVVPVMYAASLFDVLHADLVRGRNLNFCAAYVPMALVYLWALNFALT